MDYILAMVKAGFPLEVAVAANNLWLRCGLTHVLVGAHLLELRVLEGA